jgi:hypothetical protein
VENAGQLQIGLLCPCAATSGGVLLDLGGPRQRAALAVLVLSRGEVVPVDLHAGDRLRPVERRCLDVVSHVRAPRAIRSAAPP